MTQPPMVTTTEGPVTGVDQGTTLAWYAIPFAQPPVGPLRYRRPLPPEPRDSAQPLAATDRGAPPVQPPLPEAFGGIGEAEDAAEDCLTLNIVRPSESESAESSPGPLPVMVWIYGGAFSVGTARNYDPHRLVEAGNIVFVSLNYRLGPLGFLDLSSLSTPERTFEANVGFYDQIRALEWIRDNIAAFGGDPDNVTIFGESAGAMSVLTLMCMPDADGLFHKAIAQSPAPAHVNLATGGPRPDQAHWAREFSDILGAPPGASPSERAAVLDAASPAELVAASLELNARAAQQDPGGLVFGPCVDGHSLTDSALAMMESGQAQPLPLIIGTNDNEGLLFVVGAKSAGRETIPVLPETLERVLPDGPARTALLEAYPGYPEERVAAQVGGDNVFWYPTTRAAAAHANHARTWAYRFDYVSDDQRYGALGATHGQEIAHVLGWSGAPATAAEPAGTERDREFSAAMMAAWARFAHRGTPGDDWPGHDAADRATRIWGEAVVTERDPRAERRRAWEDYSA